MIDSEIEMKGLGRKHTANTHNKASLIRISHVCHRRRVAGRNQQVEGYKHTHTHTQSENVLRSNALVYLALSEGRCEIFEKWHSNKR